ncbi:succinate--hydroxymethylglutarate CoA-transferase [Indicator indicator]|uniref:succinate--hydroxymethylglutarate CoA-transferase n=1 Tax=Indicator indicator TaxID=1002788 RepID=UPI0023DF0F53|nr:succinate--hydroxymethylglutarate CoA-transferase [Indicator indicator]
MLRAGLGRSSCLCGGGLRRSRRPAADGGSALPGCSRALSAVSPSNGGAARGGRDPPGGSRAAPSSSSISSFLSCLVGFLRPLIPPGLPSVAATRAVLGAAALWDGQDMKQLREASAALVRPVASPEVEIGAGPCRQQAAEPNCQPGRHRGAWGVGAVGGDRGRFAPCWWPSRPPMFSQSAARLLLSGGDWQSGAAAGLCTGAVGQGAGQVQLTGVEKRLLSCASNVKPLDGVKILDLTRVLAGPFATMNLGDLGAEVIKVERPGAGDDTRVWGPPFVGTESIYFLSVNRNKKSIAINMKDSKGAKLIRELAAVSDVFVENFIPGKLAELGLGYEDIKKIAPHIVYCSITGYGQTGPMVQRGGYDSIAAAVSGLMHITGHEDGEPVRPGVAMTDLATGLYTHGAIMAGLLQRYKTGKGLHIDCNLLSSQVACLTSVAANYLNCKIEAKRWGTAHGSIVPYQAFKTKDGYLVVGAGNDQQFVTVCKILNLPEVSKDPRYKTNTLRVQNREELVDMLSTRFSEKATIEWLQLFEGSGVPYGPINNMQQVFANPQVLHNGLVMEMNHPTAGRIAVPGPGVRYSEFAVSHPKPPPLVGQHTVEILKGMLGYEDDAIEELLRTGAVAQHEVR